MQMHLLASKKMIEARPESITEMDNWGFVPIIIGGDNPSGFSGGIHIAIDGPLEDVHAWLKPFSPIWLGEGAPMMQQFYETPLKDDIS